MSYVHIVTKKGYRCITDTEIDRVFLSKKEASEYADRKNKNATYYYRRVIRKKLTINSENQA